MTDTSKPKSTGVIQKWRGLPQWVRTGAYCFVAFSFGWGIGIGNSAEVEAQAKKDAARIVASAKRDRAKLDKDIEKAETLGATIVQRKGELQKIDRQLGKSQRQLNARSFEGDGIYLVGSDVKPGTYKATASPGCYYAVMRTLDGSLNDIITNGNVDGPVVITVPSAAKAVEVARCGTFTRVG